MSAGNAGVFSQNLRFYSAATRLPLLGRSFRGKVLVVAFLGTHVPLLALLGFFVVREVSDFTEALQVLFIALSATLLGTALTIVALNALLRPITAIRSMLDSYRRERVVPAMPTSATDELGALARGTAETIAQLDSYFTEVTRRDRSTGALNADGFAAALQETMASGGKPSLALLELPEFPRWQVALDQEAADFIAATMVERMRLELPDSAIIGSLGRGRFAVALSGDPAWVEERFEATLSAAGEPVRIRSREVKNIPLMGTAAPKYGSDARRQISAAEAALLAAAEHGGSVRVEATDAGEAIRSHVELSLELEQGLRQRQFSAVYQKRVDAQTGQLVGTEALARWRHPKHGELAPGLFIPLAEHSGRIIELGEQILDEAAAQAAVWAAQQHRVCVSVNVAAQQLATGGFPDTVRATLHRHSLPPPLLELELTEGTLLADLEGSAHQLDELRKIGVRIALDDFGSGYSSLSYLGRLPLDTLKIDKGFVDRIHEPRYRRVVAGIIQLAGGLDLRTTAEGVETAEQANALRALGCDELQGFLYARPVPATELDFADAAHAAQGPAADDTPRSRYG